MDLVTLLATAGVAVLAMFGRLMVGEIQDWLPSFARYIVRHSASRLHPDERMRFYEEWLADLDEYPGKLSKLIRACGHARSASKLRWREEASVKATSTKLEATENYDLILLLDQFIDMLRGRGTPERELEALKATRSLLEIDIDSLSDAEFGEIVRQFEHKTKRGRRIRGTPRPRSFDTLYGDRPITITAKVPSTRASRPPDPRSPSRPT